MRLDKPCRKRRRLIFTLADIGHDRVVTVFVIRRHGNARRHQELEIVDVDQQRIEIQFFFQSHHYISMLIEVLPQ